MQSLLHKLTWMGRGFKAILQPALKGFGRTRLCLIEAQRLIGSHLSVLCVFIYTSACTGSGIEETNAVRRRYQTDGTK